jgi:uncharacterized protein with HEPN domain
MPSPLQFHVFLSEIVWDIVQNKLPKLESQIAKLILES